MHPKGALAQGRIHQFDDGVRDALRVRIPGLKRGQAFEGNLGDIGGRAIGVFFRPYASAGLPECA